MAYFTTLKKNIKVSIGCIYHRYTYKEFFDYDKALRELGYVHCIGYTEAFIKKIEIIPNYKHE